MSVVSVMIADDHDVRGGRVSDVEAKAGESKVEVEEGGDRGEDCDVRGRGQGGGRS